MRWTAPPERREVFLVVLSLSIYFLARRSLLSGDFDVDATRGILLRKVGLGSTSVIGKDGLKPAGWRDELEKEIYGTWRWDEGHVAGNGGERAQKAGADRHGAAWAGKVEADQSISSTPLATVDQGVWRWGEDIPQTTLLQHKPGMMVLVQVVAGVLIIVFSRVHDTRQPLRLRRLCLHRQRQCKFSPTLERHHCKPR